MTIRQTSLLTLSLLSAVGCAAGESSGVDLTLSTGGKNDALAGKVVSFDPDGYLDFGDSETEIETSTVVRLRSDDRLVLGGEGVTFDASTYYESTGASCVFDSDCAGYNQGVCDWGTDTCQALSVPSGIWTFEVTTRQRKVDIGFMLFDYDAFESEGAPVMNCGGQNVFVKAAVDFDNAEITIDDLTTYAFEECGFYPETTQARTQTLAAFGVPTRDDLVAHATSGFKGEYIHQFHLTTTN